MAQNNRGEKRVRIKRGHEARFIENRNQRRRNTKKSKKSKSPRKAIQRCRLQYSINSSSKGPRGGVCRTHRPSVSELVYQFLERASNRGVVRGQKSNATNQFRKLQRRRTSKRLKPDAGPDKSMRIKAEPNGDDEESDRANEKPYEFPYSNIPSPEGNYSIEKCIFEVLSLGTVLGLLIPADSKGVVFRVSSDLELFSKKRDKERKSRKRRAQFDYDDDLSSKRR